MRRRSAGRVERGGHGGRDDLALDELHHVERRADDRLVGARPPGPRARAAGGASGQQDARLAQDVVRAGRQRPGRRAAQDEARVAAGTR